MLYISVSYEFYYCYILSEKHDNPCSQISLSYLFVIYFLINKDIRMICHKNMTVIKIRHAYELVILYFFKRE